MKVGYINNLERIVDRLESGDMTAIKELKEIVAIFRTDYEVDKAKSIKYITEKRKTNPKYAREVKKVDRD